MLPSLVIGVPEEIFWQKNPKSLMLYFKAHAQKKENEHKEWAQKMWVMGAYVRHAIASSVFPLGLYNGPNQLPKYPKCPFTNESEKPNEMSKEQLKAERLRCYYYFKSIGKHK